MTPSKTQIGSGTGSSGVPGRAEATCPACQAATPGRPFCPHDGHLTVPSFVVGERYLVDERLGGGGTALVFGGHHRVLGRSVALKVLRPRLGRDPVEAGRFLRAARLGSSLQHENIVCVYDFGEDRELDLVFLVMERLLGPTLAEVLAEAGSLPWQRAVAILVQLCRALAESHRLGVLHRDLNPRNIVLTASSGRADVVKLCDFGLSRSAVGQDRVTATGTAIGTPAYMAPEQVRGDEDQDLRIDLYALGVTAYEMLSGRLPHEMTSPVAMIASKLTDPPTPLADRRPDLALPAGLEDLVMRCLASDPADRPASAHAIERELLAVGGLDRDATWRVQLGDLRGQTVGNYRVIDRINQGGMSAVYLAEHQVIGTRAALKVLLPEITAHPDAVDRFIQEARASSEIGSPHIPRFYDFGNLPDGRAYALMELVEGESVAERLALRGPLPLAEVAQVMAQTAEALGAAHHAGVIHRDIKPEHILLCRGSGDALQVKILDFGIAKVFRATSNRTEVGMFMGTPMYCAPEQVLGEPVGPAADVYALGATLYEMLTGRPPYSGDAGHVLVIKTQRDPVPVRQLRPSLPRAVAATVERMMARDRTLRPRTMRAVAAEIAAWPAEGSVEVRAEGSVAARIVVGPPGAASGLEAVAPRPRRRRWRALAAAVAAVAAGALAAWLGLGRGGAGPGPAPSAAGSARSVSTDAASIGARPSAAAADPASDRSSPSPSPSPSPEPPGIRVEPLDPPTTAGPPPDPAPAAAIADPVRPRKLRRPRPPRPTADPGDAVIIADPFE